MEIDTLVIEDVRSFEFFPGSEFGLGVDLVSDTIMRGRDHGLPDYNALREQYGLSKHTYVAGSGYSS